MWCIVCDCWGLERGTMTTRHTHPQPLRLQWCASATMSGHTHSLHAHARVCTRAFLSPLQCTHTPPCYRKRRLDHGPQEVPATFPRSHPRSVRLLPARLPHRLFCTDRTSLLSLAALKDLRNSSSPQVNRRKARPSRPRWTRVDQALTSEFALTPRLS